jgi:hypothetical protein
MIVPNPIKDCRDGLRHSRRWPSPKYVTSDSTSITEDDSFVRNAKAQSRLNGTVTRRKCCRAGTCLSISRSAPLVSISSMESRILGCAKMTAATAMKQAEGVERR